MMKGFLQNYWYVAASSAEVGNTPFGRTICGEPIVLFRKSDGSIAALNDRCPHRKYALSKGEVIGNDIQCGYHGFRYDGSSGACTLIPSQPSVPPPKGLNAKTYPAIEKYALIFVWIGEASRANESLLPDWSPNTAPGWTVRHGYYHIKSNYLLMLDNFHDLTHLAFVHKSTFGGAGMLENPLEVEMDGEMVKTRRNLPNMPQSILFKCTKRFDHDRNIDRIQRTEFRMPGYGIVTISAGEVGAKEPDIHHAILNSITPETEHTHHYFWSVARRYGLDDPQATKIFMDLMQRAFDEDQAVMEIQEKMIASDTSGTPLRSYKGDQATVMVRRLIAQKLMGEATAAEEAAAAE